MRRKRDGSSSGVGCRGSGKSPVCVAGAPTPPSAVCLLVLVGLAAVCACLLWACLVRADEPLVKRRKEIADMTPAQKQQLLRHYGRFIALDPKEQQRLCQLHRDIERHQRSHELRQVMHRYYEWLKTLSSYQRADLLQLSADERIERIKQLKEEQARRQSARASFADGFGSERIKNALSQRPEFKDAQRLTAEDLQALLGWIEEFAARYRAYLLQSMPEDRQQRMQQELEKAEDSPRGRDFFGLMLWLRWQLDHPEELPPGSRAELKDLRAKLSPATRQWLEAKPEEEQWQAIAGWIRLLVVLPFAVRRAGSLSPVISEDELASFLEQQLSDEQRDRLLSLPAEEMQRQLQWMYLRWKMPDLAFVFEERAGRGPPWSGSRRPGPPGSGPRRPGGGPGKRPPGRPGLGGPNAVPEKPKPQNPPAPEQ